MDNLYRVTFTYDQLRTIIENLEPLAEEDEELDMTMEDVFNKVEILTFTRVVLKLHYNNSINQKNSMTCIPVLL